MKTIHGMIALAVALLVAGQSAAGAIIGKAYAVSMAGSLIQSESTGPDTDVLVKGSFTTAAVINAARGRSTDAPVPANERLALELFFLNPDDQPVALLAVYDTNGQTNLAVVAELMVNGAFDSAKGKGFVAMVGEIGNSGNLSGGWLSVVAKAAVATSDSEPVLTALSGNLQGVIQGADEMDQYELIITKGKMALTGQLGPVSISLR